MSAKRPIVGRCPKCHNKVVFLPKWERAFLTMTLQCTYQYPGGKVCGGKILLRRAIVG